jgi:hypothetical protein
MITRCYQCVLHDLIYVVFEYLFLKQIHFCKGVNFN